MFSEAKITPQNPEATQLTPLEILRDNRGRIRWSFLQERPEQLENFIEQEAQSLVTQEVILTQKGLHAKGRNDLSGAITRFYPGGFRKLKENLALPRDRVTPGYWTPETIRQEAQEFYEKEDGLTQKLLARKKRSDLMGAIRSGYPGGLIGLKTDLGIELSEKPKNYWTPEKIEQEAVDFVTKEGGLSDWLLEKKGAMSLRTAIQKSYPGKMTQLKLNLGIQGIPQDFLETGQRPSGYWAQDTILQSAQEFYDKEGNISLQLLRRLDRKDLVSAIRKKYPGGVEALKKDLGLDTKERKAKFYWTSENMLGAAKAFYNTHDRLAAVFMSEQGQSGLSSAITRLYPGKWRQLRIDLGIVESNSKDQYISSDEANEQLRRLLEEVV